MVVLGRLAAPWGVKGWIKLDSYTDPPQAILDHQLWHVARPQGGWDVVRVVDGRRHGTQRAVLVQIEGVASPEAARAWVQREVALPRSELPALASGEYYWDDLLGCSVATLEGTELGVVSHFHEFPASPVLAVRDGARERWIPLGPRHLKRVDLEARRIVVDWDPEL
jgi:16S rRNA processing protein RimM